MKSAELVDNLKVAIETSPRPKAPRHPGAAENMYLGGNFAPILLEITAFDLRVHGRIPEELEGRRLCIGPNAIGHVDPAHYEWITATGLVHGVRLRRGRAEWYRSRYTMSADAAEVLGKPPIPGPGKGKGHGVNTSVGPIGSRVHALVEAGALPIELDYNLESVARSDFGGTLDGGFTAHPKYDPATGKTVAIAYEPGRPTLRYLVLDVAGRAETRADIPTPHMPMVHDVGFTKNFIIVLDLPITFQPKRAAPGAVFPYFWNERQTPRIGLLPRNGDLNGLTWFEAPLCWVWHIVNAYEAEGGEVVVDVARHPRMFDPDWQKPKDGSMPSFAASPRGPVLARWTLDRTRGRLTERVLDDHGGDFPRMDDRRGGQNYRYAYQSHWGDGVSFFYGPVYKHDVRNGRTEVHDLGPGNASLEPVFVPRSGATDEDEGYVMCYVFNGQRNSSDFVILSAQDFTGQPLAVVELPVRVPFGFHGSWVPDRP
jgi:carotenoid cleavage dioxygenase-like enzyme